jgi:DNA-directed RNA polymerase specialized sigma24 family protein
MKIMALRPKRRQAFASLIARQYDRLFRLCFRLTGSKQHEAEDLTKTSAPPLPAKLSSYKRQSKVTTWLYQSRKRRPRPPPQTGNLRRAFDGCDNLNRQAGGD